jgi:hypothetical protein
MKITKIFFASIASLFMILCCSRDLPQLTERGGSGTETVGIAGSVVDTSGLPVAGATVKLRRADFLDTAQDALHKNKVLLADAVTNDSGKYFFGSIDTGAYKIEIIDGNRNAALAACTVSAADSLKIVSNRTLKPCGSIVGTIPPSIGGGEFVTAYVYGLDIRAATDSAGGFALNDLPEGTYSIRFSSSVPIYYPLDTTGITLVSGAKHDIGQFGLPRMSNSIFPADSAALSRILDSNGLNSVGWRQVASVGPWPFRITEIRLDYKKIRVIPSDIGSLKALQSI